jgi:4-hydroxyphenylpyruvate dioxygenase
MPTPKAYYESLPGRLGSQGVPSMAMSFEEIERLGLLVDGDKSGYLLQAFCQDQAVQFRRPNAGPVFFELVERSGSKRFGEGNFRALFEAMQR